MLYAILCYNREDIVGAWTPEEEEAVMARLEAVRGGWVKAGRMGPVARLLPTTAATTLHKGKENIVLDGPFAETKEQLLGFYIVDCANLDEALAAAQELAAANPGHGSYELRPLLVYHPAPTDTAAPMVPYPAPVA